MLSGLGRGLACISGPAREAHHDHRATTPGRGTPAHITIMSQDLLPPHSVATRDATLSQPAIFESAGAGGSAFRDCPRNHAVRRRAFVQHARGLLPNLDEAIESKASHLYGTEPDGEPPLVPLETHLEKRARFYDWFVEGKPAEFVLSSAIMPDGEIGT